MGGDEGMRLIINGDDFGLTEGVTKGIIKGLKEGIITDTSALANSDYFIDAANLAKEEGILSMGVHLTITFLRPVLKELKNIVDKDGFFYRKPLLIPAPYDYIEIEDELRAQIEKFLSTGLKLNHLDTHHIFSIMDEKIFEIVVKLAKEYNVPIRRDFSLSNNEEKLFDIARKNIINTTDILLFQSGKAVTKEYIIENVDKCKEEDIDVEILAHPGYVDEELKKISSLTYNREKELEVYLDSKIKQYIKKSNVELISYCQL